MGSIIFNLDAIDATRDIIDAITLEAISSFCVFFEIREITSLSAKTVHVEDIFILFVAFKVRLSSPSRSTLRAFAITSRNRPVPAAHLSFITKCVTFPSSDTDIALESWPPISIIVHLRGYKEKIPLAWQVISVAVVVEKPVICLP